MNGQSLFHAEEMTTKSPHAKIFLAALNIKAVVKNEKFSSKLCKQYSVEICIHMCVFTIGTIT